MKCTGKELKDIHAAVSHSGKFKGRNYYDGVLVYGSNLYATNGYILVQAHLEGKPVEEAYFLTDSQVKSVPNTASVVFKEGETTVIGKNVGFAPEATTYTMVGVSDIPRNLGDSYKNLVKYCEKADTIKSGNFAVDPDIIGKAFALFKKFKCNCDITVYAGQQILIKSKDAVKEPALKVLVMGIK